MKTDTSKFTAFKVGATALALTAFVPGYAYAAAGGASGELVTGMTGTIGEIVTAVGAGGVLILTIVGAVVAVKVIMGLFRKA